MADVVGRYRKGKIQVNVVKGEFQGKSTISYTLQKRILTKSGEWKDSSFLNITDLQDIISLFSRICTTHVKFEKVEPKPKPPEEEVSPDMGEEYG